jgi:hypothetical protein
LNASPNVWVGEVSWLKAALFEDEEAFVPDAVAEVYEIIGEGLPVIDDALIEKIRTALGAQNRTGYNVTDPDPVIRFLEQHRGKPCFTISW